MQVLRFGDIGPEVEVVQARLRDLGYDLGGFGPAGDGVDGHFGQKTADALLQFQADRGLQILFPHVDDAVRALLFPARDDGHAQTTSREILIVTDFTTADRSNIMGMRDAAQQWIDEDFAPYWGHAQLTVGRAADYDGSQTPGALVDQTSVLGADGWHSHGAWRGFNFDADPHFEVTMTPLSVRDPATTLTHEMELIPNPQVANFHGPLNSPRRRFFEMCDQVNGVFYPKRGRLVSDFVLPWWWGDPGEGRYSFTGALTKPYQLHPSGFQITYDQTTGQVVFERYNPATDGVLALSPDLADATSVAMSSMGYEHMSEHIHRRLHLAGAA